MKNVTKIFTASLAIIALNACDKKTQNQILGNGTTDAANLQKSQDIGATPDTVAEVAQTNPKKDVIIDIDTDVPSTTATTEQLKAAKEKNLKLSPQDLDKYRPKDFDVILVSDRNQDTDENFVVRVDFKKSNEDIRNFLDQRKKSRYQNVQLKPLTEKRIEQITDSIRDPSKQGLDVLYPTIKDKTSDVYNGLRGIEAAGLSANDLKVNNIELLKSDVTVNDTDGGSEGLFELGALGLPGKKIQPNTTVDVDSRVIKIKFDYYKNVSALKARLLKFKAN